MELLKKQNLLTIFVTSIISLASFSSPVNLVSSSNFKPFLKADIASGIKAFFVMLLLCRQIPLEIFQTMGASY